MGFRNDLAYSIQIASWLSRIWTCLSIRCRTSCDRRALDGKNPRSTRSRMTLTPLSRISFSPDFSPFMILRQIGFSCWNGANGGDRAAIWNQNPL